MTESTSILKDAWLRGSYGIVSPKLRRTAILKAPEGMDPTEYRQQWIAQYGAALSSFAGVSKVIFNLINKDESYDQIAKDSSNVDSKVTIRNREFDAVTEITCDSPDAYDGIFEHFGLGSQEPDQPKDAHVLVSREVGFRQIDPGRPEPKLKRFGLIQKKPGLTTETLALAWRDEHAPVVAPDDTLRIYSIHLTDRQYTPDTIWDGYAELWWDGWETLGTGSIGTQISGGKPMGGMPVLRSNSQHSLYLFLEPWDLSWGRPRDR